MRTCHAYESKLIDQTVNARTMQGMIEKYMKTMKGAQSESEQVIDTQPMVRDGIIVSRRT